MLPTRTLSTAGRTRKVVLVGGSGFVGSYIARALIANPANRIVLTSRSPEKSHASLSHLGNQVLAPVVSDVTSRSSLAEALVGADVVVSLVGIMHGTDAQFEAIQWKGAENVAVEAAKVGAKVILLSAIGSDATSEIAYTRTKGLGEHAVLAASPDATILRPSLVFGPGDAFFAVSRWSIRFSIELSPLTLHWFTEIRNSCQVSAFPAMLLWCRTEQQRCPVPARIRR